MRFALPGWPGATYPGMSNKPRILSVELERPVVRVVPEVVLEAARDFLNRAVVTVGGTRIPDSDIVIPDFEIPAHWPRAYGLDVGWNRTAAVWGALDRDSDVLYLYSEHYVGEAEPSVHAAAILERGKWIRGAIDPASRGRTQTDGRQLLQMYTELGLDLQMADNAVEAGIYRVWQRLSSGRLKVFKSMQQWLAEFRLYRRDEKGKVVKERDHLMDATRYLEMEMQNIGRTEPPKKPKDPLGDRTSAGARLGFRWRWLDGLSGNGV